MKHFGTRWLLFTERPPLRDDDVKAMQTKSKLLERKTVAERVIGKILKFVGTVYEGMGRIRTYIQLFPTRRPPI